MKKGDRVCYKAQHCVLPSIHSPVPSLQLDGTRVGKFLCEADMTWGKAAAVKWDGVRRVSLVDCEMICLCGSFEALEPRAEYHARSIEWILRTTWEQRQGKTVPDTMDEILAIGPRLWMQDGPAPNPPASNNSTIRCYSVLGTKRVLCDPCAHRIRNQTANAKPRSLSERNAVRSCKHADFVVEAEVKNGHCERCGRLGPKRADGVRPKL